MEENTQIIPETEVLTEENSQILQPITKKRDNSIDILKGILTIFMIICHVIQFFRGGTLGEYISVFVGLTTFSGFMFCLGYVFPLAYTNKPNREKRMFIGMLKTLFAYYIAAMSFILIVEDGLTKEVFFKILFIQNVPDFCEFLLSFALVFALGIFLFEPIKKLIDNNIRLILILALILALTNINYGMFYSPIIGSIIGTRLHESFPIIQYGFYFLIGWYFSEKKVGFNWKFFLIAFLFTAQFFAFRIGYGYFPERFQPTLTWIVGASLFIYCYYLISKYLENFEPLQFIGKYSLFYLVSSNICIFIAQKLLENSTMQIWVKRGLVFVATLFICTILLLIKNLFAKLISNIIADIKNSIEIQKNSKKN